MLPEKDCRPLLSSLGPLRLDGAGSLECARELASGDRVYLRLVPDGERTQAAVERALALKPAPGLPRVIDAGRWDDEVWVMQQFPEGNLLAPDDRWSDVQVARHGARLAQALLSLHEAGLAHGALSHDAVLISGASEAFLHDAPMLEINRVTDRRPEETQAALWVRIARFVAPEVLSGGPATPASDVYALGVLLILQSGGVGPTARSPLEVMHQRMTGAWTPEPSSKLGASLQNCLRLMVSLDPAQRLTASEAMRQLTTPAVLDAVTDPHLAFPSAPRAKAPVPDALEAPHTSPQWDATKPAPTPSAEPWQVSGPAAREALAIAPPEPTVVGAEPRATAPSQPAWTSSGHPTAPAGHHGVVGRLPAPEPAPTFVGPSPTAPLAPEPTAPPAVLEGARAAYLDSLRDRVGRVQSLPAPAPSEPSLSGPNIIVSESFRLPDPPAAKSVVEPLSDTLASVVPSETHVDVVPSETKVDVVPNPAAKPDAALNAPTRENAVSPSELSAVAQVLSAKDAAAEPSRPGRDADDDENTVAQRGPAPEPDDVGDDPSAFELRHPMLASLRRSPAKLGAVGAVVLVLLLGGGWAIFHGGGEPAVQELPPGEAPVAEVKAPAVAPPEPVAAAPAPAAPP
ncbi:MAG: protein kinase, partial [Myxococcaceae bacterium]|nr:protein kinase [Myxococcaceae bacterium]